MRFYVLVVILLVSTVIATPSRAVDAAPCGADADRNGIVSVDDLFISIQRWFTQDFRADTNGSGGVTIDDLFLMFNGYFLGCPSYIGDPNPHDMGYTPIGMPGCGVFVSGMSSMTAEIASGVQWFSGEVVRHEVDMHIPGRGFDFVFARTYRSQQGQRFAELGHKWDYSYNIYIYQKGADLVLHDGSLAREDVYTAQPDGSWTNSEFFRRITPGMTGGYTVELANGTRWVTGPAPYVIDSTTMWKLAQIVDRNGNTMSFTYSSGGRLTQVTDTLGNGCFCLWGPIYLAPRIDRIVDHTGRIVQYAYYDGLEPGGSAHDLKSVTSPAVTGTPHGNDFPSGKTTTYTYSSGTNGPDYASFLLEITDGRGQTFIRNEYKLTTVSDPQFGRLTRQTWGAVGDVIDRIEVTQTPSAGNNFATRKIIVNDRVGNVKECLYNATNCGVIFRELTGRADADVPTTETTNRPGAPLRAGEPAQFETRWTYVPSGLATRIDYPNGNATINSYDSANPSPLARGNLLQRQRTPGPLGGDQGTISESWQYLVGFGGCGCGGAQFATQHTDPRGNITNHTYDSRGNRTRTNYPIASIVEDWEYNAFGQVTAHILPDNGSGHRRRDEFVYHGAGPQLGRLQSRIVDAGASGLALTTGYEYNARGGLLRQTEPDGDETVYLRNQLDQVVRTSSPTISTPSGLQRFDTDYTYDAANNLLSTSVENIDENGVLQANAAFTTTYEYDVLNRLTRKTREVSDTDNTVEEYTYDANGNRSLTRFGEAVNGTDVRNSVSRSYDERDRVLDEIQAPGAPITFRCVTRYHFDGNGNLERLRRGTNGTQRMTLYTYDGYNRRVTTTDPMGNVSTRHYDAGSNVTSERLDGELTDVAGSAANVRLTEVTFQYDAMNRRTRRDEAFFNAATQAAFGDGFRTTQWTYAATSAVLTETDDNAHTTMRSYDRANRLSVVTDAAGNTRTHQWYTDGTAAGTLHVDIPDLPGPTQSHASSSVYDALNRVISTTDSAGSVTQYRYDSRGNRTARIDGRGNRSEWSYDGLNRVTRSGIDMNNDGDTADAADIVTTQQWDDDSRLIAQTDDNGNTTRYAYDSFNRRIITQYADGTLHQIGQGALWPLGNPSPNVTGFTNGHDIHSNIITTRDANGTVVTHQYDVNNRLTRRDVVVGAGVSNQTTFETYSYDGRSRVLTAIDDDSSVTFTYDSLSNVLLENQNGLSVARTFDAEGNELTLLYPGGRLITTMYNELNLPTDNYDVDPCPILRTHYVGSRIQAMDIGCTMRQSFTYDGLTGVPNPTGDFGSLRVVASTVAPIAGGPAIETMAYTYDRAGNMTSRIVNGTATDEDYQYDSANRLIRTDRAAAPLLTTYALDGANNRTSVGGDLDPGAYALSSTTPAPADAQVNQYTSTPFDSRAYDANGNLLVMTPTAPAGPARTLTYDFRNRLAQYSDPATGVVAIYKYDCSGRRTQKSITSSGPAQITRFIYNGRYEIEERDAAGATLATHVWRNARLGAAACLTSSTIGGTRYLFHADPSHRCVLATTAAGAVAERYRYLDFDRCTVLDPSNQPLGGSAIGNPFRRASSRSEEESAVNVLGPIAFDPRSARLLGSIGRIANSGWSDSTHIDMDDIELPEMIDEAVGLISGVMCGMEAVATGLSCSSACSNDPACISCCAVWTLAAKAACYLGMSIPGPECGQDTGGGGTGGGGEPMDCSYLDNGLWTGSCTTTTGLSCDNCAGVATGVYSEILGQCVQSVLIMSASDCSIDDRESEVRAEFVVPH